MESQIRKEHTLATGICHRDVDTQFWAPSYLHQGYSFMWWAPGFLAHGHLHPIHAITYGLFKLGEGPDTLGPSGSWLPQLRIKKSLLWPHPEPCLHNLQWLLHSHSPYTYFLTSVRLPSSPLISQFSFSILALSNDSFKHPSYEFSWLFTLMKYSSTFLCVLQWKFSNMKAEKTV